jgi:hypothetical protein
LPGRHDRPAGAGAVDDGDRLEDLVSAPLIAASIFPDALNVFLFFLRIFSSTWYSADASTRLPRPGGSR